MFELRVPLCSRIIHVISERIGFWGPRDYPQRNSMLYVHDFSGAKGPMFSSGSQNILNLKQKQKQKPM